MLIEVDRSSRIRVYPDAGGPSENVSTLILEGRPLTEEQLKERKENVFVCLHATGHYSKCCYVDNQIYQEDSLLPKDSLLMDPKGAPYRVDKGCLLGKVKPYLVIGCDGDWLEYWYKLKPDTSDMIWGEGMYHDWDYDFESVVLAEEYWKLSGDEQTTLLTGKIQLICDQGSWFVSVNSTSILVPNFYGWL